MPLRALLPAREARERAHTRTMGNISALRLDGAVRDTTRRAVAGHALSGSAAARAIRLAERAVAISERALRTDLAPARTAPRRRRGIATDDVGRAHLTPYREGIGVSTYNGSQRTGDAAPCDGKDGTLRFGNWANNLIGPSTALYGHQRKLFLAILDGDVAWALQPATPEDHLELTKEAVGSLRLASQQT
jgi:hypothetical protein